MSEVKNNSQPSQVVIIITEGPAHKPSEYSSGESANRFRDLTKNAIRTLDSYLLRNQKSSIFAVASPISSGYPAPRSGHLILQGLANDPNPLYQNIQKVLAKDKKVHINRIQLGHAGKDLCIETGDKGSACLNEARLETSEKRHIGDYTLFTISDGCYSGGNLKRGLAYSLSGAIYFGAPEETNRSDSLVKAIFNYLEKPQVLKTFDFNHDGKTTYDEAFASMATKFPGDNTPILIYLKPTSPGGVEEMGPWHRRAANGTLSVVATESVQGFAAAQAQATTLYPGQKILALIKKPGKVISKQVMTDFKARIASGMFKPLIVELSSQDLKRYDLDPDHPPPYFFLDRRNLATPVTRLDNEEAFVDSYIQSAIRESDKTDEEYHQLFTSGSDEALESLLLDLYDHETLDRLEELAPKIKKAVKDRPQAVDSLSYWLNDDFKYSYNNHLIPRYVFFLGLLKDTKLQKAFHEKISYDRSGLETLLLAEKKPRETDFYSRLANHLNQVRSKPSSMKTEEWEQIEMYRTMLLEDISQSYPSLNLQTQTHFEQWEHTFLSIYIPVAVLNKAIEFKRFSDELVSKIRKDPGNYLSLLNDSQEPFHKLVKNELFEIKKPISNEQLLKLTKHISSSKIHQKLFLDWMFKLASSEFLLSLIQDKLDPQFKLTVIFRLDESRDPQFYQLVSLIDIETWEAMIKKAYTVSNSESSDWEKIKNILLKINSEKKIIPLLESSISPELKIDLIAALANSDKTEHRELLGKIKDSVWQELLKSGDATITGTAKHILSKKELFPTLPDFAKPILRYRPWILGSSFNLLITNSGISGGGALHFGRRFYLNRVSENHGGHFIEASGIAGLVSGKAFSNFPKNQNYPSSSGSYKLGLDLQLGYDWGVAALAGVFETGFWLNYEKNNSQDIGKTLPYFYTSGGAHLSIMSRGSVPIGGVLGLAAGQMNSVGNERSDKSFLLDVSVGFQMFFDRRR